jgi:hypothetical protein
MNNPMLVLAGTVMIITGLLLLYWWLEHKDDRRS